MKKLFCFCLLIVFIFSFAQDGSPDLSFGNNGVVTYLPDGDEHFIEDAIETSEGNILTVIHTFEGNDLSFRIFAFNQEGLPLNDFGINGILDVTGQFDFSIGISKLNGGGFLLHGLFSNQLTVSKYSNNGSLDLNFGVNGYLQPFLSGGSGHQVIVDTQNRIIVSGKEILSGVHHVLKKRFTENGLPDTSFGSNGQVLFPVNGSVNLVVMSLKIKGGYYYSGIYYNDNILQHNGIIRSDLSGTIDTGFGTNGLLKIPIESEFFISFNVFDDGNLLIGGHYMEQYTKIVFRKVIKVNPHGQIIQNFGNSGQINGFIGGHIQGNQRFILNGSDLYNDGGFIPAYSRFFPNGALDNSFQFSSNYPNMVGTNVELHLQSGKFMLISCEMLFHGPNVNIVFQRFNNNPLSVSDFKKRNVAVYPNPSNDVFQVHNNFPFSNNSYVIYDVLGKKVLSGQFNDNFPSIDLGKFAGGVYFLKIENIPQTIKLLKK